MILMASFLSEDNEWGQYEEQGCKHKGRTEATLCCSPKRKGFFWWF